MELKNGTIVLVADGEKYLLLQNIEDEKYPNLSTISHEHLTNPAAHDQSTDRAGRRQDGGNSGGGLGSGPSKSAMEQTDWHQVAKHKFAAHVADILNTATASGGIERLVLVAAPAALGEIRAVLSDATKALVIGEVNKDLTNQPIDQIEKILAAS